MRCDLAMDHRADVEEHTWITHGMEMHQVKREVKIKVNEAEALELTAAMNFKELSKQGRLEMYFCLKNVLRDQASEVCFGKSMLLILVLGLYKLMTRSIGSISSPFHSVSIQNNPNFIYKTSYN